jgi:hypothetical protein
MTTPTGVTCHKQSAPGVKPARSLTLLQEGPALIGNGAQTQAHRPVTDDADETGANTHQINRALAGRNRREQMGHRTDEAIAAWQKEVGIEPATGAREAILRQLQERAFEAIRICELERSGIRDGDGRWHGGDVIGHMTHDLIDLSNRLLRTYHPDGLKEEEALHREQIASLDYNKIIPF